MKVLTLNSLFTVAVLMGGVAVAEANETEAGDISQVQTYHYVYSPERAVGSLYHSFDLASSEIKQQAASSVKSAAVEDIYDGMRSLQQQFSYAIYIPKKPRSNERVEWRDFV